MNMYERVAAWVHCLKCHKNYHKDDIVLHYTKTCPLKGAKVTACLCIKPDFDFVPEREGLTWG